MPRPANAPPAYCLHKPSGRAYVRIAGRCVYLGRHGSPESHQRYQDALDRWSRERDLPPAPTQPLISELCIEYLLHARTYYRSPKTGLPTDELACLKSIITQLNEHCGDLPAHRFTSEHLLALQQRLIRRDWSLGYINRQIGRVVRLFRWGVPRKLVPPAVVVDLECVKPLQTGRSLARETPARLAVSRPRIAAVRELLAPHQQDVVDLLLLTGARPGELYALTWGMIDRTVDPWRCVLRHHKTAHRGKPRILHFKAAVQDILLRYLHANPDKPILPGRRDTLSHAVREACEVAYGMPEELRHPDPALPPAQRDELRRRATAWRQEHCWCPYALRHTFATEMVDALGIEAAQAVLGHSSAAMTHHYSKAAEQQAIDAIRKMG